MPGAYRDDREAARAKVAELQAELEKHRAKLVTTTQLMLAIDSITKPQRISRYSVFAPLGVFVALELGLTKHVPWVATIAGLFLVAILSVVMHRYGRTAIPPVGDNRSEELLTRFRIAEAKTARTQLDEEQQRELEEEERICTALEEEIDQMKRLG